MAQVSVTEAAERLGISPQRVRQRIDRGQLPAVRIGSRWVLDEADLHRGPRASRPMSPRIAWAFAGLLDGQRPDGMAPQELSRLRRRADALLSEADRRLEVIGSWLAKRAPAQRYSVGVPDVGELRRDPRIALSGVSDQRAGLSAASEVEGYVRLGELAELEREYLLVPKSDRAAESANVVLRPAENMRHHLDVPGLMVVADLVDRHEARAALAADRLLDGVLAARQWAS